MLSSHFICYSDDRQAIPQVLAEVARKETSRESSPRRCAAPHVPTAQPARKLHQRGRTKKRSFAVASDFTLFVHSEGEEQRECPLIVRAQVEQQATI